MTTTPTPLPPPALPLVIEPGVCTAPRTPPTHVWLLQRPGALTAHATEAAAINRACVEFLTRHGDDPSVQLRLGERGGLLKHNRVTGSSEWFATVTKTDVR